MGFEIIIVVDCANFFNHFHAVQTQIVKPADVIDGLLRDIFRIKGVLDAVITVVASAMVLAVLLVFGLSLRLRQREIRTVFLIGCRRSTIARLLAAEILIIVAVSAALCGLAVLAVSGYADQIVRALFIH